MITHVYEGVELEFCNRCHGVYLDANEASALRFDERALRVAPVVGRSARRCPDHQHLMTERCVQAGSNVVRFETTGCCAGIFLDAGEAESLRGETCDQCSTMERFQVDHLTCHRCRVCARIFATEAEWLSAGVPMDALTPKPLNETGGPCPSCANPMATMRLEGPKLPGFSYEPIDLGWCDICRATWFPESLVSQFTRFARIALSERAEQEAMDGRKLTRSRAVWAGPSAADAKRLSAAKEEAAQISGAIARIRLIELIMEQDDD